MLLTIQTSQAFSAIINVYDHNGGTLLDQKQYELEAGTNTIVYPKPSSESLYYVVDYRDELGNNYIYKINEVDY